MVEQILALAKRGLAEFKKFSTGQKAATIAAGLGLIIGALVFASWKTPATYAPLYTNLAASDASAIVDKLNSSGIPYKLGQAGSEVLVPQDKVYSTRIMMSGAGLPNSSQTGYSLLDKEGVTTSEFKQQVDYQRAIEGELDNTIEAINGVQNASVHLAIPQQDVFNDNTTKPTAAVLLTTTPGTTLTSQQVQSVVYLVSSAVPNMSPDGVTVTDQNGTVLAAAGSGITSATGASTQAQLTEQYDATLTSQLQALINPLVGAGHGVVTVNAQLNFDKTTKNSSQYTYTPGTPPISQQTTNKSYTGNGSNAGTLGTTGTTTTTGTNGAGKMTEKDQTVNNAVGTTTTNVESAPGNITKLSIGVLLDNSVPNLNVAAIQNLIKSTAGVDPTRGDQLSIQALAFNNSAAKAAAAADAAASKAAASKAADAQMTAMIKQGVIGTLILGIVLATWLGARRKKGKNDPAIADDELFDDEPFYAAVPAAAEMDHVAVVADINEAVARRRALVALAEEQPQDVASVLSNWLKTREG